MPSASDLKKFTLAELQMFAKAAKPPVADVKMYNKGELIQIMVSQKHKAKFHDLKGERFPFKKKEIRPNMKQKTVAKLAAAKARDRPTNRFPIKKKEAPAKAGNRPRENKGGCKVGRKGESPSGGCKIGKKNPSTKDKTVAKLAANKGKKKRMRVPYKKI